MTRAWAAALLTWAALAMARPAVADVANTLHNLSATGPGTVKTAATGEICIFCHAPHNANPSRGLWNRSLAGATYTLYSSTTLEATLNQPTGASRLCLSCHDGILALGAMRVPPSTGPVTLGPLTGRAALGTNLSDDHPVSFIYDAALALKQGQLADPATLPQSIRLDDTKQLQCTACHDPHADRYRQFLRVDDRAAALCTACHRQKNWTGSSHAVSPATWKGTGANPWTNSPYTTVVDNGCENCHRSHAAPRPPRLLSILQERTVCLICHNGAVTSKNLDPEFLKLSAHPIASTNWTHNPRENPASMSRHVTCADCHNSHQVIANTATAPQVTGRLKGVRGVNISGGTVTESTYEYEVCLKCHGLVDQTTSPSLIRQDNTRNIRLKISPSNPSFHPVAAVGKNPSIQGLMPGYNASSIIYCMDCHNNDEWTPTGTKPRGTHGSRYQPLLAGQYDQLDPTTESSQGYAICYSCHNRTFLINDQAHTFPHRLHVVEERAPCAVCHDAHGSRQTPHLINFMLRDGTGKTVVSATGGRIEYVSLGTGRGQCYLACHGKNHNPESYP